MTLEGHDCWEDCDEGPHGCVCGNDCKPRVYLDPKPWVDREDGPDRPIRQAHEDAWTVFEPRPGYNQNREDY